MVNDERIIVLDDVVYSTQYTILTLLAKVILRYNEKPEEFQEEDDMKNLKMTKAILERAFNDETIFFRNTFMNMVLSRPEWDYFQVPEEYAQWLLSKFYDIEDIETRVSPIMNMIGSQDVKVVYDDSSMLEKLIIKKLRLFEKLQPSHILNMTTFKEELKAFQDNKYTNLHSRPTIFTANESIIQEYGKDFSIIVPKNFRWGFKDKLAVGVVECWGFDDDKTESEQQ